MEVGGGAQPSGLIGDLIRSRDAAAVLKAEFASLRSGFPTEVVLVFEGDQDKGVYRQWIKRVHPDASYEPFPCRAKRLVLGLKTALDRDLNGLGNGVYFFIDRDYDDDCGYKLDKSVFMTDRYSIENYLISVEVLEELLKNSFHCHGKHAWLRNRVIERFDVCLKSFIDVVRDVNLLLYVCRRRGISIKRVPSSLRGLVCLTVDSAEHGVQCELDFLSPERAPTEQEINDIRPEFEKLDPLTRYRGKFFFSFFHQWLELLAKDRKQARGVFDGVDSEGTVHNSAFTLDNMASYSSLPEGFSDFIRQIDWNFCGTRAGCTE